MFYFFSVDGYFHIHLFSFYPAYLHHLCFFFILIFIPYSVVVLFNLSISLHKSSSLPATIAWSSSNRSAFILLMMNEMFMMTLQ